MKDCPCTTVHTPRRIVVTGGPGAGKTALLELVRRSFCKHVGVLPEAASIVFGGGFPREDRLAARRASQRAIFHVQRELEASVEDLPLAVVLCDRGTVDGAAYWVGGDDLFAAVGTTLEAERARYAAVLHMRTPAASLGYNHDNPVRLESASEALAADERIAAAWAGHPRRFVVEATGDFLTKVQNALAVLRTELPACCRRHELASQSPEPSSAADRSR